MVNQQSSIPVSVIESQLSAVDTNNDGRIEKGEVLNLVGEKNVALKSSEFRKKLLYAFVVLLAISVVANSLLGLGFNLAIKDTGSSKGDLVDKSNNVLHSKSSEQVEIVKIDSSKLADKMLILVGKMSQAEMSKVAHKVTVGSIDRAHFLDGENNAKHSNVNGIAHYGTGEWTNMVRYRVLKFNDGNDGGHEVGLAVTIGQNGVPTDFQFGAACPPGASTQCSIFAYATEVTEFQRSLGGRISKAPWRQSEGTEFDRSLMQK